MEGYERIKEGEGPNSWREERCEKGFLGEIKK
jgi:hypothetical protein